MTTPVSEEKALRSAVRSIHDRTGLFPVNAAAYVTMLHPGTIRRWIRERRIPAYGWRGAYRVRLEDLLPEIERENGK